jgi:integrase
MPAELFSVIAAIRRHLRDGQAIPLLSRYDPHERQASPAMLFTPHDFRRFATELVNNGLPIHIGAALLGH